MQVNKSEFKPVIITLETLDEYNDFISMCRYTSLNSLNDALAEALHEALTGRRSTED